MYFLSYTTESTKHPHCRYLLLLIGRFAPFTILEAWICLQETFFRLAWGYYGFQTSRKHNNTFFPFFFEEKFTLKTTTERDHHQLDASFLSLGLNDAPLQPGTRIPPGQQRDTQLPEPLLLSSARKAFTQLSNTACTKRPRHFVQSPLPTPPRRFLPFRAH